MEVTIRKVQPGDERDLAFIQTESWKSAFAEILDPETLERCTNIDKATDMYKHLLDENIGNGYLLFADEKPQCIAYWDAARDEKFNGKAELICIHSLKGGWRCGYGSKMMERVISDMKTAGYSEVVLWVFKDNLRARKFYEAMGFEMTEFSKTTFNAEEVLYQARI